MQQLLFSDADRFYAELDAAVQAGERVGIAFFGEHPAAKSRVWPRLRRCSNWRDLEAEFQKIQRKEASPLSLILAADFARSLVSLDVGLAAWSGVLVGAVVCNSYRHFKIQLEATADGEDIEIQLVPSS